MKYNTVRGMRDLLPEQAKKKQYIIEVCKKVFEKYGFEPMETPIVEELGLLSKKGGAGEEIRNEVYYFKDKSGRELGLRFDLTVPLARVIASNPQLPKPFKRYQIGNVYRYDRPQAGRYREFAQADADIIGTASMLAEFECIAIALEIMQALGIKGVIKINNRKLLEEIATRNGVKKSQIAECLRAIDKLEKIGARQVEKELKQKGIKTQILGQLGEQKLERAIECDGKKELSEIFALLKENRLLEFVKLNLALARGLDYYTGTVFEIASNSLALGAGGRYNRLIELYGGKATPAVGISFGIDRLMDATGEIPEKEKEIVFISPVGKTKKDALALATKIRKEGIACEMDLLERGISKNLEYASKKKIRFAMILGEEELKQNSVTVRDMRTGKQNAIKLDEIVKELKRLLEKPGNR